MYDNNILLVLVLMLVLMWMMMMILLTINKMHIVSQTDQNRIKSLEVPLHIAELAGGTVR